MTKIPVHHHFSRIAKVYRSLRKTDEDPIAFIAQKMEGLASIQAVDVGCGAGRYDLLLHKYLGDRLHLFCVDANEEMLESLREYLHAHSIRDCVAIHSGAEDLPFPDDSMDCVYTFNAVHHFDLPRFLCESARILKRGGYLFIYTRLRQQNRRNIWGRFFPKFHEKETRLHTLETLSHAGEAVPGLQITSIEFFKYERTSTLSELEERARARHYSTFSLYTPEELEEAISGFRQELENSFDDLDRIRWSDENIMLVARKGS